MPARQGQRFSTTVRSTTTGVLEGEGLDTPVISSAGALLRGLEALGARGIVMVTPYLKPLTKLVADYIEDAGVEVVDALSLEASDNLEVARLDPAGLREHWRRVDTSCGTTRWPGSDRCSSTSTTARSRRSG